MARARERDKDGGLENTEPLGLQLPNFLPIFTI